MKVRNKVREAEIMQLPIGGTLALEHCQPLTFSAGWWMVIRGDHVAVISPEHCAEEFDLPKEKVPRVKRVRRPTTFGLGKGTNSDAQSDR